MAELPAGSVLLIGFGNPGRLDDGLGPALAKAVEQMQLPGVTVDSDYQLTVEDADAIAHHKVVIFADADVSGPEPFSVQAVVGSDELSFSSHSASPAAVVGLAKHLFAGQAQAFLLGMRGYEFNEFAEVLSEKAAANLDATVAFIGRVLRGGSVESIVKALNDHVGAHDAAGNGEPK